MTDEIESARREMILDGLEEENFLRQAEARFNLYSRSQTASETKVGIYQEYIAKLSPYIEWSNEAEEVSEEDQLKKFLEMHRKLAEEGDFKID